MHTARFRDPAGSVREGTYDTDTETVAFGGEEYALDEVDVLPPADPTKIVCVGLNYADHAAEQDSEIPDRPLLFLKPPNALSSHGDTVALPAGKDRVEWEAELAVVIGEQCRNVDADDAMDVVAGFTCMNDISNRDDQRVEQNWVRGKAFDNAAPLGPVLATPEEVPADASVELRVNGETKQASSREEFIFAVPELIEEITTYQTLEEGDVISTGTPAGVGPLSDGDTVEVEIEGVGVLEHDVVDPDEH
ncbi:fumarylacetoacetate hydrolase family protein [Haloparvum sp. PAK95]|uniref:fumarylacetoacetate hydrolase family protein n=1 Tax=Haloparvum sp. PAK95 TaxID=3418962 RepID=UPI003D2F12CB